VAARRKRFTDKETRVREETVVGDRCGSLEEQTGRHRAEDLTGDW